MHIYKNKVTVGIVCLLQKSLAMLLLQRKSESLIGYKLMIIQPLTAKGENTGRESVGADYVGAGIGEIVLVGSGSSVRVEESKKIICYRFSDNWNNRRINSLEVNFMEKI